MHVRREDPKHRATTSPSCVPVKERLVPIYLRRAVESLNTHPKLTKHQWLAQRKRRRRTILDELFQRRRRIDKTIVIVSRVIVYVAIVDCRNRMVRQPLAPFRRRTITPRTRRNQMIRIERLQITTHLRKPRAPFSPTSRDHLRFVHQLPTEDCRVVAISNAGYSVTARGEFFQVFAIEPARLRVRIEENRFLVVDAEGITIVGGI